MNIFISYRHEDSLKSVERLVDHLEKYYGRDAIFKDVGKIQPGSDVRKEIDHAMARTHVLIAVVGQRWLGAPEVRINDPNDFVRLEIKAALDRGIHIIPLTVDGAAHPSASSLPATLEPFAFLLSAQLRDDPHFAADVAALCRLITRHAFRLVARQDAFEASERQLAPDRMTKFFEEELRHRSQDASLLLGRGINNLVTAMNGNRQGLLAAIDNFEFAAQVDPSLGDAHVGLGSVYVKLTVIDLIRRRRYKIHRKGTQVRGQVVRSSPPQIGLFNLDRQTKAFLSLALDEYLEGLRLRSDSHVEGNYIVEHFGDPFADIALLRGLLGHAPAEPT